MAQSCESKAVSAEGKPLHGAAKNSFVKKCKKDACESKAVSAEGKPLHGAAKKVSWRNARGMRNRDVKHHGTIAFCRYAGAYPRPCRQAM